ncbi:enoyl-CoA hydratase/isomerase family protein [Streptomyces sp. NPDC003247]|uniref:enoyl-CoA hydratase/isomerase family protein n=1 Tax=Streptomyces sp. NPDC003247 TaxID=3364677 RepID=UPI0036C986BF
MSDKVEVRVEGQVAHVTVGDGTRLNALPTEGWSFLAEQVDLLSHDPGLRAVVVRGRGGTFCAGSDLSEWLGASPSAVEESFAAMERAFTALERCPVPVVAAIEGTAAGAGCQLALACDIRYIGLSGRIGMPIARLGILASTRFAARMTDLVGPSITAELLYTGALLDAREAAGAGLVTRAVPDARLGATVARTVARIVAQPDGTLRAAKRSLRAALGGGRAVPEPAVEGAVIPSVLQRSVTAFLDKAMS